MSVSSMMAEKRLRKYRKAFSSSGWNLHAREKGLASKLDNLDGPAFYLCDIETGQLHVVVTRADVFPLVENKKREEGVTFSEICDAFGSFYSDICTGKIKLSSEASSILAFAVALYISGTQGYQLVLEEGMENMHYLVIRHWDYSNNSSLLRPVPIKGQPYYRPEEIEALVDEVLSIDRRNHPERFKMAEVIPFKIKERVDL